MSNFPNIIYNIKDSKYDQYSVMQWIKYYVFFLPDDWINPFELFLIRTRKKAHEKYKCR